MTKLEELIQKLCPNGVEHKPLNEVSEMKRGTSITKKDIVEGEIPVVSGGREPAYYCDKYNRDGETITVAGSEPVLDMFSIGQSLSLFVMRFQYREILGYKRNIYIIF